MNKKHGLLSNINPWIVIVYLVGVGVGLLVGLDLGFSFAKAVQLQGLEAVHLNETAARHCNMTVENATARIACSPNLNQSATYP